MTARNTVPKSRIQLTYDGKGFSKINLGSFVQE